MSFFQPWLLGGLGKKKKKKKKGERYSPRWNTPQTWSVRSTGSQICHSRPAAGRQWSCSSWGWVWAGATVWRWRAGPGRRSGTGASSLLWLYHKNWQIYKKTVQIRRIFHYCNLWGHLSTLLTCAFGDPLTSVQLWISQLTPDINMHLLLWVITLWSDLTSQRCSRHDWEKNRLCTLNKGNKCP